MKKLKMMGAVVVVLLFAAVMYRVKTMYAQGTAPQTIMVTITPNSNPAGPPSVNPDSVDVYKDKNQQVEWTCSTGCDFSVNFPTTGAAPFQARAFSKANPKSGVPTGPPGKYPYRVTVGKGSTDPMIIVH